jgi:hypothetical protein
LICFGDERGRKSHREISEAFRLEIAQWGPVSRIQYAKVSYLAEIYWMIWGVYVTGR